MDVGWITEKMDRKPRAGDVGFQESDFLRVRRFFNSGAWVKRGGGRVTVRSSMSF
jgi:hypothetical protein